jgi:hypothetical protein
LNFSHSAKVVALQERLQTFMESHIYPNEGVYKEERAVLFDRWQPVPLVEPPAPCASSMDPMKCIRHQLGEQELAKYRLARNHG